MGRHAPMDRKLRPNEELPKGRKPGTGGWKIPQKASEAMAALQKAGWLNSEIGMAWGVSGNTVQRRVNEWSRRAEQ